MSETLYAGFGILKYGGGSREYRGVIRRVRDKGVIWECEHVHGAPMHAPGYQTARDCAVAEMDRRTPPAPAQGGEHE